MKKIYFLIAAACLFTEATSLHAEKFKTAGNKTVYSLDGLSAIAESGVTKTAENEFKVAADFTISETDTLRLDNNCIVRLDNKITIRIEGYADFCPKDTALITRVDGTEPKGIQLTGDSAAGAFKKLRFEYASLKASGKGIDVKHCTFTLANGKLASGAIDLLSGKSVVEHCAFISNGRAAISSGANTQAGVIFRYNYLYHNSTENGNRPQINMGAPGENSTVISENIVIGDPKNTKVGGIAVANMLGSGGRNKVIISKNYVTKNRYGITLNGSLNGLIADNRIVENKYDPNPLTGGSGISIASPNNSTTVKITRNHIEDNLWGITVIDTKSTKPAESHVNIGRLDLPKSDPLYNEGGNVLKNNGNNGINYDLYNNTPHKMYAQGNVWNVAAQDSASIESVVFHANDKDLKTTTKLPLGEVIYWHPSMQTGLETVAPAAPMAWISLDRNLQLPELVASLKLYRMDGNLCIEASHTRSLRLGSLPAGVYILEVSKGQNLQRQKIIIP